MEEKRYVINFPSSLPFMQRTHRPPDSAKAASLSHLSHAKSRKRAEQYFTLIQVSSMHISCVYPPFSAFFFLEGEAKNTVKLQLFITLLEIYSTTKIWSIWKEEGVYDKWHEMETNHFLEGECDTSMAECQTVYVVLNFSSVLGLLI